jgi:hypothetical protein
MSPLSESTVFFDESTLVADEWVLERIANAARRLVPSDSGKHIFIKLDHFMDSHLFFLVVLGTSPDEPQCVWKATVIDENTNPQFEKVSVEE